MNDTVPPDPAKRERLLKARAASDEALKQSLDGLERGLIGQSQNASKIALKQIQKARDELTQARIEVDRVAAIPFDERTTPELRLTRKPIDQMFAVIDTVFEGVTALSAEAERIHPDLSLQLVGARYAAELREYAGRLGSQFTIPLATQSPLGIDERRDIPVLVGRIQQLRKLVEVRARVTIVDAKLDAAMSEMNKRYFGVGLPFINQLTEAGLSGKSYQVDSAKFVARYVPEMKSIVELRDAMFETATAQATIKIAEAHERKRMNIAIGLAILCIELIAFTLIQRRVLMPLLVTTNNMLELMRGKLDTKIAQTTRSDEIGDIQNAVVALKLSKEKSLALEIEREQLIDYLKIASEVDFLTGLLNRRALTERGLQLLVQAKRQRWSIAVVLFDIDHFKLVNDAYGHSSGDEVLTQVAAIAKAECRQADLLARYGGAEFILLAFDCDGVQAVQLAERIRSKIEQSKFSSGVDTFNVTASFGVAHAQSFEVTNMELVIKNADRALYSAKSQGRNRTVESDLLNPFVDGDVGASAVVEPGGHNQGQQLVGMV